MRGKSFKGLLLIKKSGHLRLFSYSVQQPGDENKSCDGSVLVPVLPSLLSDKLRVLPRGFINLWSPTRKGVKNNEA